METDFNKHEHLHKNQCRIKKLKLKHWPYGLRTPNEVFFFAMISQTAWADKLNIWGIFSQTTYQDYFVTVSPLYLRDRSRFFDQVGHQTTNTSIGNKHFFTK